MSSDCFSGVDDDEVIVTRALLYPTVSFVSGATIQMAVVVVVVTTITTIIIRGRGCMTPLRLHIPAAVCHVQ